MIQGKKIIFRITKFFDRFVHRLTHEEREKLIAEITPSASPGFDFFLLVILSCSIATLGLITNSAAVIIGAMLLAPLMSPIIGIGLASVIGDDLLIRKSASALIRGAFLAILLSFAMTLINRVLPFVSLQELPAEILSRTRPSPIDLLIALAGGLAAAYALTRPNLSATLPGVAIATALMPPLCTIGFGLAMNRWDVAGGATLLFVTNTITIASASALVFFIRGFSIEARRNGQIIPRSFVISLVLVLILLIPLTYFSVKFVREAAENRLINTVVSQEFAKMNNAQLVDLQIIHQEDRIQMIATIRTRMALRYQQVVALQQSIVEALQVPVSIKVDQIVAEELDPLIPPTATPTLTPTSTLTPGPSPTVTSTRLPTHTQTATPTATPAQVRVASTGVPVFQLYQSPNGPVISWLSRGQWLTVLYGREEIGGIVWVEVQDEEGRLGWIPEIYLLPPTATPISSAAIDVTLTLTPQFNLTFRKQEVMAMFIIMFVLDDTSLLDELLASWSDVGISGATIIESSGLYRRINQNIPMRYLYGGESENEKGNMTLFVAVDTEEKVQTCLQAAEKVVGDLNDPNSGVFLAWPLTFSKGITSHQLKGD